MVIARCCALSLLAAPALAQSSWVELTFTHQPFARQRHDMVFDAARSECVVFGGWNGAAMADTWTLGASDWTQRTTSPTPPARADHALAFDPVRQVVVMLGGWNTVDLRDIWEWNGTAWTQRMVNVTGLGQAGAACYDPTQGGVFYNRNNLNLLWDGTNANTVTVAQPLGNSFHRMVFDAASGGVVSVGGQYTLLFRQPQGWQQPWTYSRLFSLSQYAIASDPAHSRLVFHGGNGTVGNTSGGSHPFTWEWTGTFWRQLTQDGPGLDSQGMAFDPARGFLMFGGNLGGGNNSNRTWRLQEATTPATWQPFGSGCSGALAQAPRLAADLQWNAAPVIGGLFFVLLDRLPANQLVFGFIGTDNTQWSGGPLPAPLAPAGMPGCDLLVRPDSSVSLGIGSAGGAKSWITSIPNDAVLLGVVFFQQAAVLAPGANAAGVLWSNGGQGIVGLR
jgi:hypothetical protein